MVIVIEIFVNELIVIEYGNYVCDIVLGLVGFLDMLVIGYYC